MKGPALTPDRKRSRPRNSRSRSLLLSVTCLATTIFAAPQSPAAEWPARPIHIVAPFGPAGAADKFARVLADYLPETLKQPVVVENRGGGGGIVGSALVARAEPDGYTLLISSLASQAIAPALNPNPGFDSLRDFTHIAYFGGPPIGWVVTPSSDLYSVNDVIATARAGNLPGYASSGIGTLGHLVAEAVIQQSGVAMSHIPYNTAALQDILAGHVDSRILRLEFGHRPGRGRQASRHRVVDGNPSTRLPRRADVSGARLQHRRQHMVCAVRSRGTAEGHRQPPQSRGVSDHEPAGSPPALCPGRHRVQDDDARRTDEVVRNRNRPLDPGGPHATRLRRGPLPVVAQLCIFSAAAR